MSKFLDTADAMKAHLEDAIDSSELAIIVDRQKDIQSEVDKHLVKLKGGVAAIEFLSANNSAAVGDALNLQADYSVTLITTPILRAGKTPAADLLERICKALNGWQEDAQAHCYNKVHVKSVRLIQNPRFLIYQIKASKRVII